MDDRVKCFMCGKPIAKKGELKGFKDITCNCIDESKCMNVKIVLEHDEHIYWEMFE